jgi:hypothetical protein
MRVLLLHLSILRSPTRRAARERARCTAHRAALRLPLQRLRARDLHWRTRTSHAQQSRTLLSRPQQSRQLSRSQRGALRLRMYAATSARPA